MACTIEIFGCCFTHQTGNGSCHIYEWVVWHMCLVEPYVWMSHVTKLKESCHRYERVIRHIWIVVSHMIRIWTNETFLTDTDMDLRFARTNESCHTYEWVMSHVWISHVTHMNASSHTYECVKSHIWLSHVTHMDESHMRNSRITRMNKSCHAHVDKDLLFARARAEREDLSYRVARTHRMTYLYRSFPAKEPYD